LRFRDFVENSFYLVFIFDITVMLWYIALVICVFVVIRFLGSVGDGVTETSKISLRVRPGRNEGETIFNHHNATTYIIA
jgi:hypothetical protein